MAKKSKSPLKNGDPNSVSKSNEASNSSTVFNSLFGEVSAANSLFSDDNPFQRKFLKTQRPSDESKSGLAEKEANLGDSDYSEAKQSKKRKKDKSKKESSDIDAEVAEEKSKKLKRAVSIGGGVDNESNLGFKSETVKKNDESGALVDKNEKKKRKRKRDEVEVEYEAKRYGVADETKESESQSNVLGGKRKKMENTEDTMVPKEGFDDEDKLLRTVFVGNLPLKLKKKEIAKEFSKFGEVESVRIRSVPVVNGKVPRKGAVIKKLINENANSAHAYVVFKTEESAQASLAHNMAVVGGNHIRVDRACPPRKKLKGDNPPLYESKRTVFLGNLPFDVKDEEIYQLFSSIKNLESSVEAARVIRDPGSSLGKGIAYVLFKTVSECVCHLGNYADMRDFFHLNCFCKAQHGNIYCKDAANLTVKKRNLWLRGRELRVSHAKPTDSSSKATNNSQPQSNSAKKLAVSSGAKANISYQGLHASKSGGVKKVRTKINTFSTKSKSQPSAEQNSRTTKRPSVAARKEKALRAAANASKVAGTKRKLGNPSPQSGGLKKKPRNFS